MRPATDSVLCDESCDGCATNKARSDWQLTLPHLEYLDLQIGVYGLSGQGGIVSPARCVTRFEYNEHEKESKLRRRWKIKRIVRTPRYTVQDVLDGMEVLFNPEVVRISVLGFACEGYGKNERTAGVECEHGCGRRIAAAVKGVSEMRKQRTT
jgi:hypothetical protein